MMVVVEVAETVVVDRKGQVKVTAHRMPEYAVNDFIVNLPAHQWVADEYPSPKSIRELSGALVKTPYYKK